MHCRMEAKGIPRLIAELQDEKEASPECSTECRLRWNVSKRETEGDRLFDMCEHVERRGRVVETVEWS